MTYKIIRKFANNSDLNEEIATGLTLKEAQAHCRDPETSSRTCTDAFLNAQTNACGPWFDAYEEE